MKITAAISPCPNDVFIFSGILTGAVGHPGWEFGFEFHDVETLNRGAQERRWDLVKISYANFPRCERDYQLLRCGGALGRGCGPLLLSNHDGWDPTQEVLVPGRFTTANFLLDFFNREKSPLKKNFQPFDALYRRLLQPQACQGVVIHEMRFTYAGDGLHLIQDLGAFWEAQTGYPIPLGAATLRRGGDADAGTMEALIRASLDWAHAHPREALDLCRLHSQAMAEAVLKAHIDLYVNAFSRNLGRDGEAAVAFFLAQQKSFCSQA